MKKTAIRKTLAFIAAMSITASLAACNDEGGSTSGTAGTTGTTTAATEPKDLSEEDKAALAEVDVGDAQTLENGTVRWLSDYDINPEKGKPKRTALELFETNYGGSIEYIPVSFEDRYNKLATLVNGGESPDIFPAQEFDTFPSRAVGGMFESWDDYLDFNDADLWKDSQGAKKISDMHVLNGKHYVAAVYAYPNVIMVYNQNTIDDNSLDDPWELLNEDQWTWDAFRKMCNEYCSRDDDKFAYDGWWFETGLTLTTGVPAISFENNQMKNNLMSPELERVQNFMYELKRDDMPLPKAEYNWTEQRDRIASGNTLFYPIGMWALWEEDLSNYGKTDEIRFVPLPRDPGADAYYVPASAEAYTLCKGAPNPEGAAAFLKCVLAENGSEAAQAITEKQYREDYGWTDLLFEMKDKAVEIMNANPMISFHNGLPADVAHEVDEGIKQASFNGTDWGSTRESLNGMTNTAVEEINNKIADFS